MNNNGAIMAILDATIRKDIVIMNKIKNEFGYEPFILSDIKHLIDRDGKDASGWINSRRLKENVRPSESSIKYFERISRFRMKLLQSPILVSDNIMNNKEMLALCKNIFREHGMTLIEHTKKDDKMAKEDAPTKPIGKETKIDESFEVAMVMFNAAMSGKSPLVAEFEHNFKKATNVEKTELACLLNPFLSKAETLIKFNQMYPVYAMPSVKKGDTVFHPIAGKKEVVEADEKWIYFYGNGSKWKCDRNGYIDGLKDKPRSVWETFESYAKDMNK